MKAEQNGRPGGVQHPEEGSPIPKGKAGEGHEIGKEPDGADPLEGADALGDSGADVGRGGD